MGSVDHAKTLGALSSSDSDSVGTWLPCDGGTGLFPIVPTGELSSVEAVSFPGERDPVITQLPAEMLVGDCSDVVNRDVTENSGQAVPGVIGDPAVVAMVGFDVMPMGKDTPLDCADKCAE